MSDRRVADRGRTGAVSLVVAMLLLGSAGSGRAALITWQAPQNETGHASDVITTGALVETASAAGTAYTVNGVTFAPDTTPTGGGPELFSGSPVQVIDLDCHYCNSGAAPDSWDPEYRGLTSGSGYASPQALITLAGLTVGQAYQLQIFEPWWNANYATGYAANSDTSDSSAPLAVGIGTNNPLAAPPQYVVGTFVADASTQNVYMFATATYVMFDALQLRTEGVPEPGSVALVGTALSAMGAFRRRRRRIGSH